MKKLLIMVGGFAPAKKFGGPAVSIYNLCELMQGRYDIVVITVNHDLNSNEPLPGIESRKKIRMDGFSVFYLNEADKSYKTFANIAEQEKPNLIYLNSLFSYKYLVPFLRYSKKKDVPILIAPRGELCENAFKKRIRKIAYLSILKCFFSLSSASVHITADNELEGVKKWMDVDDNRIYCIQNVPSIPREQLRYHNKNVGECRAVFVSRIHPKKNLLFALECLKSVKGCFQYDIYGSIEDESYWRTCQQVLSELPANIKVKYRGLLDHDTVIHKFSEYDLFFFPTKSENYGHVIAESLMAGCPVLTSDQVPWCDMEKYKCGYTITLDERDKFISVLNKFIEMNNDEHKSLIEACNLYMNYKIALPLLQSQYSNMFERCILLKKEVL